MVLFNLPSCQLTFRLKQFPNLLRSKSFFNDSGFRHLSCQNNRVFVLYPYSYAYGRSKLKLDYISLGDQLKQRSKIDGGKNAVISVHENVKKNFSQLDHEVNKLSASLDKILNLKKGNVVALWSANCYNWILIQYACARRGLILCTLNPVYKIHELRYALEKSGAKALFLPGKNSEQEIVNDFTNQAQKLDKNLPLKTLIFIDGTPISSCFNEFLLSDLLNNDYSNDFSQQIEGDDPGIIMFTSGTTGKPKGALLSHFNLINNAYLTGHRLGLTQEGVIACIPVPLFHIFGLVYGSVMMTQLGITIVLPGYRYNVRNVINAINEYKCSHIMMVPSITIDILNYVEDNSLTLSSLHTVITGSAPTTVETVKKFLRNVPNVKNFFIRYGSTETGGCMTMPYYTDKPEVTMDNVGSPLDLEEIKIVDIKTRKLVKIGEKGELMARGHNVMLGYWQDEQKTKEKIDSSNWFNSGDIAKMDGNGRIKIVGRTQEMIIRGGENIYPKEIEELLHQHQQVYEAFVCGVPDERMGEEICAWIKLKNSTEAKDLNEKSIIDFCKGKISYFKIPRYIIFVEDFPRTATGKAQKFIMTEKSCQILGISKVK